MKIMLNGDERVVTASNLSELLEECELSGRVATAVNEEFVPVNARKTYSLKDGDRVEVLAPMQGG